MKNNRGGILNFQGVTIGIVSFFIIGIFHPIVIKAEYYFSKKIWPVFLIFGMMFIFFSMSIDTQMLSAILGVTGFTCLWSIHEIFEQEKRVQKGWYPKKM